jgi:ATP-dependent DNA ligase
MNRWKPEFGVVPLAEGRRWRGYGEWLYQEKKDGVWCERSIGDSIFTGELCRDGTFWVFDLPVARGADISGLPLRSRLEALSGLGLPAGWRMMPCGNGGEFLEAVLAAGGEGVVAKRLDSVFGEDWIKCKRSETQDCVVVERHRIKDSARLEQRWGDKAIDCGWVSIFGNRFARVRLGDVVEVECHSRHPSGKLREPRIVRLRPDKTALECRATI